MLIALNKPLDVLCQFSDRSGRQTLADFVPVPGVYPAGRLDRDSEGLVLLTDDGRLQARLADPAVALPKRYLVQVEGTPRTAALDRLRRGVTLADGATKPAVVDLLVGRPGWLWPRARPIRERRRIPTGWLTIEVREGRNRQVRRMTAAVGLPTLRLVRVAVGPCGLAGLRPGEWREIDSAALGLALPALGSRSDRR